MHGTLMATRGGAPEGGDLDVSARFPRVQPIWWGGVRGAVLPDEFEL